MYYEPKTRILQKTSPFSLFKTVFYRVFLAVKTAGFPTFFSSVVIQFYFITPIGRIIAPNNITLIWK